MKAERPDFCSNQMRISVTWAGGWQQRREVFGFRIQFGRRTHRLAGELHGVGSGEGKKGNQYVS